MFSSNQKIILFPEVPTLNLISPDLFAFYLNFDIKFVLRLNLP